MHRLFVITLTKIKAITAMLLWSSSAILLLTIKQLPVFLVTGIIMGGGGVLLMLFNQVNWQDFSCLALLGIALNHFAYIFALHLIPAPAVELIYCLWPLIVAVLALHFSWRLLLAVLLIIAALSILYLHYKFLFLPSSYFGILIAFAGPLFWALYVAKVEHKTTNVFLVGFYLFIAALIALSISYASHESWAFLEHLNWRSAIVLLILMLGPCGLAYMLWEHALESKQFNLAFLGYLIPFSSYLLLLAFGFAAFDWLVLSSLALLSVSGFIIMA